MDSVTNETLIGATVMIDPDAAEAKNLGPKGTITDFDGKFELKVPKAVKYVVVSFVGYKNAKLDVTKTTEFEVMLQPDQDGRYKTYRCCQYRSVVGRTSGGYDCNSNEWSSRCPE